MRLLRATNEPISAHFSFTLLSRDKSATGVLITDLTSRKEQVDLASVFNGCRMTNEGRIARELHDSVGQLLAAIGNEYRCCPVTVG